MLGMELVVRVHALPGPGARSFKSEIDYRAVATQVRRALNGLVVGEVSGARWSLEVVTLEPHNSSGWGDGIHLRLPPALRHANEDPALCGRAGSAETTGVPAFVTCLHCRSNGLFHEAQEVFWSHVEH